MQEAVFPLRISRLFVQTQLPWRALRVDLASARRFAGPAESAEADGVEALRIDQLVRLADSLGTEGLLLRGDGSALGRSGLRGVLRHLRACYDGWIALHTRGPDPRDLAALLAEPLLDFIDLELAWMETDPQSCRPAVRLAPSFLQAQSILCRSHCRCAVRFTSYAEGEVFSRVSAAFDAFVRRSSEPVAVQVLETAEPAAEEGLPLEFVACRPAWLAEGLADWLSLHRPTDCVNNPQPFSRLR